MAGAQASHAAAPGKTEARSRAAEMPVLGAPTPGLAEQKAGARRSVEGADACGAAARSLSPSTVAERASPHRCHCARSFPACTHKLRDPQCMMDTRPPASAPALTLPELSDSGKKLFKERIDDCGHL